MQQTYRKNHLNFLLYIFGDKIIPFLVRQKQKLTLELFWKRLFKKCWRRPSFRINRKEKVIFFLSGRESWAPFAGFFYWALLVCKWRHNLHILHKNSHLSRFTNRLRCIYFNDNQDSWTITIGLEKTANSRFGFQMDLHPSKLYWRNSKSTFRVPNAKPSPTIKEIAGLEKWFARISLLV